MTCTRSSWRIVQGIRLPVSRSKIAVIPFFIARVPVRRGVVAALRSWATDGWDVRIGRFGPILKWSAFGGYMDLMPKALLPTTLSTLKREIEVEGNSSACFPSSRSSMTNRC